jgi:predicted alpha/beta superfamily hydrolase
MLDIFPVLITPFNQERQIRVFLPKNYNLNNKHYPVMYMHDGQNLFHDQDAINGTSLNLENYLDEQGLEVIVVGIDQNPDERVNEYCPWVNGEYSKKLLGETSPTGGKGDQYIEFIVNELKPFIDQKYRTLQDQTAMVGISLGGLISTYAACKYPQIFTNVAIFSSAFYRNQEEIEKLIQSSDLSLIESFYLDCGTKEAGDNDYINEEFLASNKAVYENLKERILHTRFEIIEDAEHHYRFFRKRVHFLFSYLYGGN